MRAKEEIRAERQTVKAGLKAYRGIEEEIRHKLAFAEEVEDGEKYRREAAELRTVKQEIIRCLNGLPSKERSAVYYHYIKGQTWAWTSVKCAYSERQIRNIGNQGLDRLTHAFSESREVSDFCLRAEAALTL